MSNEISNSYSSIYAKTGYLQKNTDKNHITPAVDKNSDVATEKSTYSKGTTEDYCKKLCEKFNDLSITIGNYKKGEFAGNGFNNVMISQEYIEKAANDPKIAAELEKNISGIPEAVSWLENMCEMGGSELISCGVVIDKNGGMSSWSCSRREDENDNMASSASREKTDIAKLIEEYKKNKDEDIHMLEKYMENMTEDKIEQIKRYQQYQINLPYNDNINFFNTKA